MSGPFHPSRSEMCSFRRIGPVLYLSGEIDLANAADIAREVVAAVEDGVHCLDLSAVAFCDAAGLRVLLAGRDRLVERGRALRLVCSPIVLRLLEICDLTDVDGLIVTAASGPRARQAEGGP
jgi:anti-anti-sigma factor